jgi:hypothetical protein
LAAALRAAAGADAAARVLRVLRESLRVKSLLRAAVGVAKDQAAVPVRVLVPAAVPGVAGLAVDLAAVAAACNSGRRCA